MNRALVMRWVLALGAFFLSGAVSDVVSAAEVGAELSRQETFVGLPVTLRIEIANVEDYEPPEVPEVDGLEIESQGAPSQSSRISIVGGRRSEQHTVTFSYRVTPQREGTFTIAPMTVTADGLSQVIPPVRLVASKSEASDLLIAEVESEQTDVYVGEPLELTLKIWVRPFRSEEHEVVLSEGDMWRLIAEQSDWGIFQDRLQELAERNQRPRGREVLREDSDGNERSYYLYEIDATVYPKRPGALDADAVRLIARYPTELDRSRSPFSQFFEDDFPFRSRAFGDPFGSPFGSRLVIRSTRPVLAEAPVESVEVAPIPTADRPDDFRGAVGQYDITTEATPTEVPAGDPITLRIGITGTGPMDLVRAPPLSELPELAGDFQVPEESLPGFVDGNRKIFSTTIRPRHEGVTEIPAIPFTYFDPDAEEFVTVRSEPIAVKVSRADTLALDSIDDEGGAAAETAAESETGDGESTVAAAPRLEHRLPASELLRPHSVQPMWSWGWIAWAFVPPLVVLALALVRNRHATGAMFRSWGSPKRRCRRRIARAEHPGEVAAALRGLVARRYRLTPEQARSAAVVGALRADGQRDSAIALERILDRCGREAWVDRESDPALLEELKEEALRWVDRDSSRPMMRSMPAPGAHMSVGGGDRRPTTLSILLYALMLAGGASAPGAMAADSGEEAARLSRKQQQMLVEEAGERYRQARRRADGEGSAAAKEEFAQAAERYQTVVDSGVRNSDLYFYLGNAYLQSGQHGRAIANYRRALRLRPAEEHYRRNLRFAQQAAAAAGASESGAGESDRPAWSREPLAAAAAWLERWVSIEQARWIGVGGWLLLWAAVALRLYRATFAWKSLAVLGLLIAVTATLFVGSRYREWTRDDVAVVIAEAVTLRHGDGRSFPPVAELTGAEGRLVEVLDRRSGWYRVRASAEAAGWVREDVLEPVACI